MNSFKIVSYSKVGVSREKVGQMCHSKSAYNCICQGRNRPCEKYLAHAHIPPLKNALCFSPSTH